MELEKANLHMDQIKCQINTQITLEEDKNISDRNPDVVGILMENGRIIIEEIRPGKDTLALKGKMIYEVLYLSDEGGKLYRIWGEIPWDEKVRVEGMENIDNPRVQAKLEDLRSGLINSRKISIRALVSFCIETKEIKDEEILTNIIATENIEVKKEPYSQSVIKIDKKDVFRIKEDLELPSSLPSVGEVLWKYLDLGKWEIRPLEDSIGIQGEVNLFVLYEGETEGNPIKAYETTIPFSGNIDCPGCNSLMTADIVPQVNSWNVSVKQDYDGEDRVLDVEMLLDVPIQLYEKRELERITDVYGTSMDVIPEFVPGMGKIIRDKYQGKVKISDEIKIPASAGRILQISHIHAAAEIESSTEENGNLNIEGIVPVTVLYMTDDEEKNYEVVKKEIPFAYIMEHMNLSEQSRWKIRPMIEQCNGVILDENHLEVKIIIYLDVLAEDRWQTEVIRNVQLRPLAQDSAGSAPGMVVYVPGRKEDIWSIGKKYGVSLDSIREINQLTKDQIERGQKVLLVKEML